LTCDLRRTYHCPVRFDGKKMRARRRALGISIYDISRATGEREEKLRRWERGSAQPQTPGPVFKIAQLLGMPAEELYTEESLSDGPGDPGRGAE
jgi:transcriptional regulator with XRE-family HTH domain